jgi:multicomponent Na+:H+ antiporter subunit E
VTRYVVAVLALTLVYALALGSFHPWDLLFGAGLSAALLFASRRFVFDADGTAPRP